jgi:hypothetical protein
MRENSKAGRLRFPGGNAYKLIGRLVRKELLPQVTDNQRIKHILDIFLTFFRAKTHQLLKFFIMFVSG